MSDLTPIPEDYDGWRFRSRLECRWWIFFKSIGISAEYEPIGFALSDGSKYLPDFWLPSIKMFAEVKAAYPNERESIKAKLLVQGSGANVLFLDGLPDFRKYYGVTMDCGQYNLTPFSLDVANYHKSFSEGRLFSEPDQHTESEFSTEYRRAIHLARSERFHAK